MPADDEVAVDPDLRLDTRLRQPGQLSQLKGVEVTSAASAASPESASRTVRVTLKYSTGEGPHTRFVFDEQNCFAADGRGAPAAG